MANEDRSFVLSVKKLIYSRLFFQFEPAYRVVIYLLVSCFIGLVAFAIALFNPTTMTAKILVGLSFMLAFGCSTVIVSEIRLMWMIKRGYRKFHIKYWEIWLIGFIILLIGFFILGGIQHFLWRFHIEDLTFYFDPESGFMPFSLRFFLKTLPPTVIDILLVAHIIFKKVPPEGAGEKSDDPAFVNIQAGKHQVNLNTDNITHISIDQHYSTIHLNTVEGRDKIELKSSLVNILSQLQGERFMQVHRSHVVNLDYVAEIKSRAGESMVIMKPDSVTVPVSRRQMHGLKSALQKSIDRKRSHSPYEMDSVRE